MMRQLYCYYLKKHVIGLLIAGICLSAAAVSQAVSFQWDATSGPSGTWDSITPNWYNGSTDTTWSSGSDAIFGTGPTKGPYASGGTVTVDSGGVAVQSMTFNLGGYVLQTGPITLTGTPVFTVTNAADTATINSAINGTGIALTKSGSGTLILGGSNSYTGGTTVNSGILEITNTTGSGTTTGSSGLGTGSVTIGASGTLWLNAASAATNTDLAYGANAISGNGTLKISAPNTNWSTALIPGDLSGFTGTIDINPYNGVVGAGKTRLGGSSAYLPSSSATIKVENGTTLYINQPYTYTSSLQLYGAANAENLGALRMEAGAVYAGSITLYGNSSIGSSGNCVITGNIGESGGSYSLSKPAGNTLILAGTNNYSGGTTISSGTLQIGVGGTTGTLGGGTVATTGATLAFNRGDNITVSNLLTGTGAVNKYGNGVVTLTSTSTGYTGTINVLAGTLQIGDGTSGSKGSGAITLNGTATINFNEAAGGTQANGALTFSSGDGNVQSTYGGSGNTSETFSSLASRSIGATGNFVVSGGSNGATNSINLTGVAAGYINQGLFFGGSNYAYMNAAGTYVRGINYGTDGNSESITTSASAFTSGDVYEQISGSGQMSMSGSQTITTLSIANSNNFSIADTNTLTVNGILLSGGNTVTMSGGATSGGVRAASGAELVIRTDATSDNLTISASILANGTNALTKTGAGTLNLSGVNAYTGATYVDNGVLNFSGSLGISPATAAGALYVSGNGTLNVLPGANIRGNSANWYLGNVPWGAGVIYQTGGTVAGINQLQIGANNIGSYGYYKLSNGSITAAEIDVSGFTGASVGVLDISGGTMNVTNWLVPARGTGSTGIINMTGGTLNYSGPVGQFLCNWNGANYVQGCTVINVKNASFLAPLADVNLMQTNVIGKLGEINLLTGGVFQAHNVIATTSTTPGTSLLNFNGGTLKAGNSGNTDFISTTSPLTGVYVYSGGGTIDNNGQAITIAAPILAPTGNGVSNTVTVTNGGSGYTGAPAIRITGGGGIGAAGYATVSGGQVNGIVITNPGVGYTSVPTISFMGGGGVGATTSALTTAVNTSGGLTFTGTGTTTITGSTSTYTGSTTVNSGTLVLSGNGSLNNSSGITINGSGAKLLQNSANALSVPVMVTQGTLDGTTMVNTAVVGNGTGGIITNGGGTSNPFYINTLTFNGTGTINLNVSSTSSVLLANALNTSGGGSVSTGLITINATNASWSPATYYLINYNTLGGVGFADFRKGTISGLSNRQSATLSNPAGYIALTIAGDNPVWTGLYSGNWTTATIPGAKNWKLITSGTPTDYLTGDLVTFDDNAFYGGGTTSVSISDANVNPTSVTFNNSSVPYYINGPYGIIGTGSLTLNGYSSVSLNTASTYGGGTTLNVGTLNINNASAIGTGPLSISGAGTTIDNTSGTPITLTTANAQNWNYDFTFAGSNDLNLGTGAVTLNGTRTITTSNSLGTGVLTVGGPISGAGYGVSKDGPGIMVLGGASTYTGNTSVLAGSLIVGPGGSIDSSANADSNITIGSAALFVMNGGNVTLGNNVFTAANNNNLMMQANDSSFYIASGTLTCSNNSTSWNQIRGNFTQTGGSVVTHGFSMSDAQGATTTYYLGGTGTMSVGQGNWASLPVGLRGGASFYVSGSASLTVTGAAGPANNNANQLVVGALYGTADAASHLFIQQGGTVTTNGLVIGSFSGVSTTPPEGIYNLNGGTLVTSTLNKGAGGNGTLNFGGGTLRTGTAFSTDAALTTVINAGGATIDTSGGNLTWSGVLAAGTSDSAGFTGLTNTTGVYTYAPNVMFSASPGGTTAAGFAVLNLAGQIADIVITEPGSGYTSAPTITIDAPPVGAAATATGTLHAGLGGLTKVGSGTLTLANANTYTGPTLVSGGTLLLSGTGSVNTSSGIAINGAGAKFVQSSSTAVSVPVTVTTGTLDGTTTVNTVVVTAGTGGIVANGNSTANAFTIGSLTFNGAGAMSLNTASTSPVLNVTSLTTSATAASITLNASNTSWTSGTVYDLVSFSTLGGLGFNAFTLGTVAGLTPRQGATLTNLPGYIALSVTGGNVPIWTGAVNGNWTTTAIPAPKNWKLSIGGAQTDFMTADTVLFDDSATGTTAVSISDANVSPTSVTFNNTTAKTYTISSTGGYYIDSGYVSKSGNGSVTINTNNTYTGGTTVNAGSLTMTGNNNFGAGGVTVTGGTLTFSGASTLSGPTLVSGGSLVLSPAIASFGTATVTVNGGSLDLNGFSPAFTDLESSASTGTITNNNGASVITLTSGNYSGKISDNVGTIAVTKNTTGTQILSGVGSNYSGGTTISAGTLSVGSNSALGTGVVTMNSGTLAASVAGVNIPNNFLADVGSTFNTANSFTISGNITDGVASQPITGGGTLTLAGTNVFALTNAYAGVFVQGGSTLSITGSTTISGTGTINGFMTVGNNTAGNGAVTVLPGGTLTINGNSASSPNTIFGQLAATGELNVSGGNVVVGPGTGLIFGNADAVAAGTLNVNSGTITINSNGVAGSDGSAIMLGRENATAVGTINLNGGTLATDREIVRNGSGSATGGLAYFNFNGGTLKALVNQVDWLRSNVSYSTANAGQLELTAVTVQTGGAIINSNGYSVAINNTIAGFGGADGGLKKIGAGTLTLSGANTYNGGATINGGVLSISSDSSLGLVTGQLTLNKDPSESQAVLKITAGLALDPIRPFAVGTGGGTIDTDPSTFTIAPLTGTAVSMSGPLTLQGGGVVVLDLASTPTLTSSASLAIAGGTTPTTLNAGGSADPFSSGSIHIDVVNNGNFNITSGSKHVGNLSGTGSTSLAASTQLTATSVSQSVLTLGSGSTLTIAAIPGGPSAGNGAITPVPEPSTWAMLVLAAMGLAMYWRRNR
jgi:fibronectin-binding autotransporter adhesin